MQGAAFMGAFFRASKFREQEGLDEEKLFEGILDQLNKKFGKLGAAVVQDNLRVIRRGYDELFEVPVSTEVKEAVGAEGGVGPHSGHFWTPTSSGASGTRGVSGNRFAHSVPLPARTASPIPSPPSAPSRPPPAWSGT
jgi:hypothetical protein